MSNTYEQNFKIRYSEGDRHGHLKLRPLFDYAQEVAGNHASILGVSSKELLKTGNTWMLSRIKYEIFGELPMSGEEIRVFTYPREFDHMFARREFRFFRNDGTLVAKGTSLWLVVNLQQLKIVIPDAAMKSRLPNNSDLDIAFESVGRLNIDGASLPVVGEYDIKENMLDINCHLNNAECGAFIQNFLGCGKRVSEVQVNYMISVPPDSKLSIRAAQDESTGSFQMVAMLDGHQAIQISGKAI